MSTAGTIGLAVGPAIVVGLTSYKVARLQVRAERREEHRRRRAEAYHGLLVSVLSFQRFLDGWYQSLDEIKAASDNAQSALEHVYLMGADEVRVVAQRYGEIVAQVGRTMNLAGPDLAQRLAQAKAQHEQELEAARVDLLSAMRADVGPEAVD